MNERPADGLAHAAGELRRRNQGFALVGGLAIAVRGEPRATQDVDLAVAIGDDAQFEALVRDLAQSGYRAVMSVEQAAHSRLGTVRLESPVGVIVDLLGASCGIEAEIVAAATLVEIEGVGPLRVATAEDLLAMKLLSARPGRARDWDDARVLIEVNEALDLNLVRARLALITARGYARNEDLAAKLGKLLAEIGAAS